MTRTGFYPGSFDPVTFGHIDIARRATKLVDCLVVAIGTHHDKKALFAAEERVAMVVDALRPVAEEDLGTVQNLFRDLTICVIGSGYSEE